MFFNEIIILLICEKVDFAFRCCSVFAQLFATKPLRPAGANVRPILCLLPAPTAKSDQDQFFADFNERKTKQKIKMRK